MTTEQLTEQQLNAFGNKLEQFGDSLSPIEQRLLAEILSMAAASAAEQDVEGHMFAEMAPSLLAHATTMDVHMYLHTLALHLSHSVHAVGNIHQATVHAIGNVHQTAVHAANVHAPGLHDPNLHSPK